MSNIDLFVSKALEKVGVPWVHQGRNSQYGLDCIGLIVNSMAEAGFEVWDDATYRRRGDAGLLTRWLGDHAYPVIDWSTRQTGDILVFGVDGLPYHAGILVEGKRTQILHAHQKRASGDYGGNVILMPLDGILVKHFVGAYRLVKTKD
jgi:cell wall-associated NlpC family hydrolase